MAPAGNDIEEVENEAASADGLEKPNIKYWISQLDAAEDAAKESRKLAKRAWNEYLRVDTTKTTDDNRASNAVFFPLYWASVRMIQPAIYSRTPIPVAEKMFKNLDDNIGRLAATSLEQLASFLTRSTAFDRVQYATRDDYIHAGKATNRVFFESEIEEKTEEIYYTPVQMADPQNPQGQPVTVYVDSQGKQPEPGAELLQDAEGKIYAESRTEALKQVGVELLPVYDYDILHNPNARHEAEITFRAFRTPMMKEDAVKRFGKELADKLKYSTLKRDEEEENEDKGGKNAMPDLYAEVWEIWDKRTKSVYWVDRRYSKEILDSKPDPYKLKDFFPCPAFMLGTVGNQHMYVTPDHTQLEPIIQQVHAMSRRLKGLIRATRRKGIADIQLEELGRLAEDADEGDFLFLDKFVELIGDGGLEKLIKFFPTKEFVAAASEMAQVLQLYEQKFYDLYGIPDILRGVSDPQETASAQQLKGKFLSLRFSTVQREFQRLVRDDIELMCDLALRMFPQQKLMDIIGVNFWKSEEKPLWGQVYLLLQNDQDRAVRINIETDSTITMNQNADIEQRNYLAKTIFEGVAQIAQAGQANPALMPLLMETLLLVVGGLQKGKDLEATARKVLTASLQAQQQPQQPPPPDPKMAQVQMQMQKNQMDAQLAGQKLQMAQAELQFKGQQLQVELQKIAASADNERTRTALDAQIAQFNSQLESMKFGLDQQYLELDMKERFLTEARLQQEAQAEPEQPKAGATGAGDVHLHIGG